MVTSIVSIMLLDSTEGITALAQLPMGLWNKKGAHELSRREGRPVGTGNRPVRRQGRRPRRRSPWPFVLLGMLLVALIIGGYTAYTYVQNQIRIATTCDTTRDYSVPNPSDSPRTAIDPDTGQQARTYNGCLIYVAPDKTYIGYDINVTPMEDDITVDIISHGSLKGNLVRLVKTMSNTARGVTYAVVVYLTADGKFGRDPVLVRCSSDACPEVNAY